MHDSFNDLNAIDDDQSNTVFRDEDLNFFFGITITTALSKELYY